MTMEAGTVPDRAIISHRGEKYEIGRGKRFYGIWVTGAPYEAPVDRWPETRHGWEQAWARFIAIETPGSIAPVERQRARLWPRRQQRPEGPGGAESAGADPGSADPGSAARGVAWPGSRRATAVLTGEGLLVLGVALGLAGLFPRYVGGQSLLSQSYEVVPHLCYVLGWALSAALIALGMVRQGSARLGALFGLGLGAVTFGLFLADVGEVVSGGASLGSGLVLSLLGWLACTAGSALALGAARHRGEPGGTAAFPGRPVRPSHEHAGPLALLVLAGIGTAVAFAPSWDSYTLNFAATGSAQTITAGNAFANPGVMIAGNVAVMAAVIMVAALAALWRPARQGALLLAGAIVPLAAQAVSALIQIRQPATPAMFGISQAQAAASGLTITSGVTPVFWVYCVFVISLLISCAWLFTAPEHSAMPGMPAAPWFPATSGDPAARYTPDEPVSGAADSDADAGEGDQSAYA